jgi:hypothetical protein
VKELPRHCKSGGQIERRDRLGKLRGTAGDILQSSTLGPNLLCRRSRQAFLKLIFNSANS